MKSAKRDQIVAIDLGSRVTKAVHLRRNGAKFDLLRYVIQDVTTPDLLAEHLKTVTQSLDAKTKFVTLVIGMGDSVLRNIELPPLPVSEMRLMLKLNTKTYFQQELPDHSFDCHIMAPTIVAQQPGTPIVPQKYKVWVGGAKNQLVLDLQKATRSVGLIPDQVTLSALGPVNAFENAHSETFAKDTVALVDIGFKNTTISILTQGQLTLSRVVPIGGDKITTGLSELLGISYIEAEGIKIGMPGEVQSNLQTLLAPLGRELRASIDFFEHQFEKSVSHVYLSGGGARSEVLIHALQTDLMLPCTNWDPTATLNNALPPQQASEVKQVAAQLTVALGAALSSF